MYKSGSFHFYRSLHNARSGVEMGVSTPWTGFLHFYIKEEVGFVGGYLMCQRPERAFFISTTWYILLYLQEDWGVNALNGLSSFLHSNYMEQKELLAVCQRPERAFFISTPKRYEIPGRLSFCVNALNGLSSFLQETKSQLDKILEDVSTPWTGFLHFY